MFSGVSGSFDMMSGLKKDGLYKYVIVFVSIIYACSLAYLIPMDDSIKDRVSYLMYASDSGAISLRYLSSGILAFLANEPAWLGINMILSQLLSPEQVVFSIVLFSAFWSSYLILKFDARYFVFLLVIVFFPQVILKYVVHLRQGLAISIFLLGWFSGSKNLRYFLFFLTPFVHSSFFFILFLVFLTSLFKKIRLAFDLRTILIIGFGVSLSFIIGVVAEALGARQGGSSAQASAGVSGLGFVFWLAVFLLYMMQGRIFCYLNSFTITTLVFYMSSYFFTKFTGRIFESALILVLLSGLALTSWRKLSFLGLISAFFLLSWGMKLGQPWLGWGTGL